MVGTLPCLIIQHLTVAFFGLARENSFFFAWSCIFFRLYRLSWQNTYPRQMKSLPVAVIGAGPVGLAAAAHLYVRGIPFLLFEAGPTVAANIQLWKHIRIFSPWKYNIDKAIRKLLSQTAWESPDDEALPTGGELFEQYFRPFYELPCISENTLLNAKVVSIGRKNVDKLKTFGREKAPFVIQVIKDNERMQFEARAVMDATGTWSSPNPIGSGGVFATGELENGDKVFYGIPDILGQHKDRYKGKKVLVVGSGHSSINAILELEKLKARYPDTEINWVLRKENIRQVFGGQEDDALEARGALGIKIAELVKEGAVNVFTPFQVQEIIRKDGALAIVGIQDEQKFILPGIDEIISNTGSRPDFSFLREIRLSIDPSLESVSEIAELIDPNIHSCGTVRPHGEKELRHPDKVFISWVRKVTDAPPHF